MDQFISSYKLTKMRAKRLPPISNMEIEPQEEEQEEPINVYDITKPKDIFKKFNEKWA